MNRFLTAIVLLLVAASAFADSGSSPIGGSLISLQPVGTDYSVAYLSQIFGTMGGVLHSTSSQMLGHVFAIFNKGVIVAAALWLGYTTASIVLHAAGDGTFVGQNRNVHLVLLRIAMGFALIIPSSTTGYSILQDLFMKIVIAGVGLADDTWDAALEYMRYGGELYIPPKQLNSDTNVTANGIGMASPSSTVPVQLAPVSQIFQDEVCMIMSSHWQKKLFPNTYPQSYSPIFNPATGWVYFPGVGDSHDPTSNSQSCGAAQNYFLSTLSATTTYDSLTTPTSSPTAAQAAEEGMAYQALKQLVMSELPAAQTYVDNLDSQSQSATDAGVQGVFSSMVDYANLITQYQTYLGMAASVPEQQAAQARATYLDTGTNHGCTKTIVVQGYRTATTKTVPAVCNYTWSDEMAASDMAAWKQHKMMGKTTTEAMGTGWIMAGAFYWNLEQVNNAAAAISISKLFPNVSTPSASAFTYYIGTNQHQSGSDLKAAAETVLSYATCTTPVCTQNITNLWGQYVGAQQNGISVKLNTNIENNTGSSLQGNILGDAIQDISDATMTFNTTGNYNPISMMMQFGDQLIAAVGKMWQDAIILSVVAAGFSGICDSMSPGGVIIKAILTWMKSIVMLLSSIMLAPGAILAFYVPLYPFAIFTCAAIGWLIMVIEGVAAAPLVCMGLTHPEGHDFLGKAEQALMLFLGIFLRPALMIIGLIASMVVSFVAFHMLITGYTSVIASFVTQKTGTLGQVQGENQFSDFICAVLLMATFGIFTLEIIEQSYKLIYQLPNNIMTWIGGQRTGEDFGQMAAQLKSGVSSTSSSLSQGAKGVDDANTGLVSGIGEAKKQADKNADKKSETHFDE